LHYVEREDPGGGHPNRAGGTSFFLGAVLVMPAVRPAAPASCESRARRAIIRSKTPSSQARSQRHQKTLPHLDNLFLRWFGLEVVAVVLLVDGVGIRFWNYALYCGAIAAGVLTLIDLPQPSDYAAEGYRVLWTLCGVAIGVLVMFLAGLLAKRTAKTSQPAPQPA
jgi:hypothetical protein